MDLKTKLESAFGDSDERAVSPVIGVILMVAITVILAAVIATFVLDLGGNQQQAPQASFSLDGTTVTHEGGDSIPQGQLKVVDSTGSEIGGSGTWTSDPVSAGTTFDVTGSSPARVIWTGADGDQSAVLASFE